LFYVIVMWKYYLYICVNIKTNIMRFNKKQLQIISYCLANLESDCEIKETRQEMHNILCDLQDNNIWGHCDFYKED